MLQATFRASMVFNDNALVVPYYPPQSRQNYLTPNKQRKLGNNSMAFSIAAMGLFTLGVGLIP